MAVSKKYPPLVKVLEKTFGYSSFREGQQETIQNVLDGQPTLSIFPTGSGKSLCYQLPALLLEGKTSIVISPLLSLIRAILKKAPLGVIAVDEAHCVSEWGNSFRPSYLLAASVIRKLKPHALLALTATATKEVARDIRNRFKIKTKDQFQTPLFRDNLQFLVQPCTSDQRGPELCTLLQDHTNLPAIVYVMKQIDAEEVSALLNKNNIPARAYHAGMNAEARQLVQDDFTCGKLNIVVATIAFGMGVNKPDIRTVVHYHLPKSPEGWVQEAGRAGRDGLASKCILLGCGDDLIPLTNYIFGSEISRNALERVVEGIFSQGESITISKYQLCSTHDVPEAQLDIILSYLIGNNYIVHSGNFWRYVQVSRLRYATHEYARAKQNIVQAINDHWGQIDTLDSENTFGINRTKLLNIINEMTEVGDVAVKHSGRLEHYTLKTAPESTEEIIDLLMENFVSHRDANIKRIDTVNSTATTRSCIPARLIKYFGETLPENCGKCSSCLGQKRARKLPSSSIPQITETQLEEIKAALSEHQAVLSTPLRLARFCCGILTPALRRAKLYSHPCYGKFDNIPFNELLTQCKVIIGS